MVKASRASQSDRGRGLKEAGGFATDYRAVFEGLSIPSLVIAPPDFVIVDANAAHLRVTNMRREDLVGRKLFEVFPENPDVPEAAGAAELRASLDRVLATRRADEMPVQRFDIRGPGGAFEERWWSPVNSPVFGEDGSIRHFLHQTKDVTAEIRERRRADQAQAAEAHFRAVADAIPGLVFEVDLDGRDTYVNEQYRAYTGLPLKALLGHGWMQVLHAEDSNRVTEACLAALRTRRPFELECRMRRADGAWRWFMVRTSVLRGADGRVERAIGVGVDIDDAKRAEAVLRQSEEQFRTMADSLPQLAWMADPTGRVYWYNRRVYEYTGATLEEMRGWGWRKVHHPDHVDRVVARIQHAWDTGEPWEDTFPLRGADGRYRWFLSRAEPLKDAQGRVTRWFGTNTDITEQKETAELQRTMLKEVSHRVKNSLALVSSVLKLQSRTVDDGARSALQEAALRVQAVARVHDQLWRGAGTREIDLKCFLRDLCEAVATSSPKHATSCDAEPAFVSADVAAPLGLLVNEFLTNAYKHAYPEGEEGQVRLSGVREPDGRYRIEVVDHGRGLPAGFDLAQARESLGIRLITSLAAQLGGELTVGSADPGARFSLVLPRKPAEP